MEDTTSRPESLKNGRYKILNVLGAGGFGTTYRCEDMKKGEICAIKEYFPESICTRDHHTGYIKPLPDKEQAYMHGFKRFQEEAALLMKMRQSPGVVHVWEMFEENQTTYYVMEYLNGKTLKQLMRAMGGCMPYHTAREAIVKAGDALEKVHSEIGIFHRDISPENIMVMPDGSVKLIDFGSAKAMAVSENQKFSVVLKPGFAPPEQYASNMSQGSFTDVYALAGTFYYLASGKKVPTAPDRLMGTEYERLDKLVPECEKKAADAVENALKLDVRFRTQTVAEFIAGISPDKISQKDSSEKAYKMDDTEKIDLSFEQTGKANLNTSSESISDNVSDIPITRGVQGVMEVLQGRCAGQQFELSPGQTTTVGRLPSKSSIVLAGHPEISGLHFRIQWKPEKGAFYIFDESTNGIYYQGIRLEKGKKYKVFPGDQLGIGSMNCIITVWEKRNNG